MTELPDLNDGVAKFIDPASSCSSGIHYDTVAVEFAHNWQLTGNNWVRTRCEMRPHFE